MPQRQAMAKERDAVIQEYGERLPFVSVSRCPFCGTVPQYPMDAEGLDGPWWFGGNLTEYPQPNRCRHLRVLLGAIDFQSQEPGEAGVIHEVLPGPGAPFLVPRLLERVPAMKAVIASIAIPPGYVGYPIAYFSEKPVHGGSLHQPWARQAYQVVDEQGRYSGLALANDKFDVDLQPWVEKDVVFWINPGDAELKLQPQPPCPYVNLPGVRAPQKIVKGRLETLPLPTGVPLQPFE